MTIRQLIKPYSTFDIFIEAIDDKGKYFCYAVQNKDNDKYLDYEVIECCGDEFQFHFLISEV